MNNSDHTLFYYDKQGTKLVGTCKDLNIPEDIFQGVIDNLNATLDFVAKSSISCGLSQKDIEDACNKAIAPYSKVMSEYGYEFFISEILSKHEILNISCMLREI